MGTNVSRPECNVPIRMLIGIDNSSSILMSCARHRVAYMWGLTFVFTTVLLVGWSLTREKESTEFRVPIWLVPVPLTLALLYAANVAYQSELDLATERIEQQLSGMSKKDYLNYKIGDDRATRSFMASATSAGILASSGILGPFLRGDRR